MLMTMRRRGCQGTRREPWTISLYKSRRWPAGNISPASHVDRPVPEGILMADTAASLGRHGAATLPAVEVDSYNLELKDDEGFLGDRASRRAFHSTFWKTGASRCASSATDPFGDTPSDDLSRSKLDVVLKEGDAESRRRDPERDRGVRAGARPGGAALPQGEGLGRHRAHRDGRRLPRKPDRRARDRARRPHPQGGRHQDRPGARSATIRTRPR